ncbi:hypothetical protein ABPG72_002667 [Tetrahymena utriculariae]
MGQSTKLSEDDFFIMNKTFSIWLIKKKNKYFDDLSTNKQRKYFKKFVKKWNKKDLSSVYYDEDKLLEKYGQLLKQKSFWKIEHDDSQVSKLYKEYQEALNGVNQMYDFKNDETDHKKALRKASRLEQGDKYDDYQDTKKTRNDVEYDREKNTEYKREQDKYDRRRERKNKEELMDELVPKKVGKEAILEKKRNLNDKLNGNRDHTGIDDYDEDFLMGGDSFSKAKAREEEFQRKKQEKEQAHNYEREQKQNEYKMTEEKAIQSALDKQSYMNRFR